jgi:hypothetical protein
MGQVDIARWIYVAALSAILAWYLSVHIRYALKYRARKSWPGAEAIIQRGTIGLINRGRNCIVPASFIGYAFKVQGERYAGYFVLLGQESTLQILNQKLTGALLQVRYDPSDPNVSLLLDYKDFRFEGLTASQDPDWLNQAPTFDLQDAIRG